MALSARKRRRRSTAPRYRRVWCGCRYPPGISTRKLIIAALLCGLALLVAFSLQLVLLTR